MPRPRGLLAQGWELWVGGGGEGGGTRSLIASAAARRRRGGHASGHVPGAWMPGPMHSTLRESTPCLSAKKACARVVVVFVWSRGGISGGGAVDRPHESP